MINKLEEITDIKTLQQYIEEREKAISIYRAALNRITEKYPSTSDAYKIVQETKSKVMNTKSTFRAKNTLT